MFKTKLVHVSWNMSAFASREVGFRTFELWLFMFAFFKGRKMINGSSKCSEGFCSSDGFFTVVWAPFCFWFCATVFCKNRLSF